MTKDVCRLFSFVVKCLPVSRLFIQKLMETSMLVWHKTRGTADSCITDVHSSDLKEEKKKARVQSSPRKGKVAILLCEGQIHFLLMPRQKRPQHKVFWISKLCQAQTSSRGGGSSVCLWGRKRNANGFKCVMEGRANNVALCLWPVRDPPVNTTQRIKLSCSLQVIKFATAPLDSTGTVAASFQTVYFSVIKK